MFPQRNHHFQQPMPNSQHDNYMNYPQMMGYPQPQPPQGTSGYFGRPRFGGYQSQIPHQYYQQPQAYQQQLPMQQQYQQPFQQYPQLKQSIFHDENGKLDFKKISGGIQSTIGIVNQVSPLMKTLGGLFNK